MLKFRLEHAPRPQGWSHPDIDFDNEINVQEADGLLAWGAVDDSFLSYRGIRAWYISEPLTESCFRTKYSKLALSTMISGEFLHHSILDPAYHVPAETHYGVRKPLYSECRPTLLGATTNNFGNFGWRFLKGHRLRNKFLVNPKVALYGSTESWSKFRNWPWSRPSVPTNFVGPTHAGNCHEESFWKFLTKFKIYVCLENSISPYWFTEKFVNAARSGCVPIYHAHQSVRQRYLNGAAWIDPVDYDFDVEKTLVAAVNCDHDAIRKQNYEWLQSPQLDDTNGMAIWTQIANILVGRYQRNAVKSNDRQT